MANKLSPEQIAKMQAARKAKAEAAKNAPASAPAGAIQTFKPAKASALKPLAKAYIPKGTPVAAVQSVIDECVTNAKAAGVTVTRVAGTLRLF